MHDEPDFTPTDQAQRIMDAVDAIDFDYATEED